MRMYDIISHKRDGIPLCEEEIRFFVRGYTEGRIPDYQASALLMAIYLRGMNQQETALLTSAMAQSGEIEDLSNIHGMKADKHSTGGVGDKTTLAVVPMAKMSGRGLGHTGGTLDKLESIPGYRVDLTEQEFSDQVNRIGAAVIGQTRNLAPADKKLYALRDVTATVSSIPLIASSIMSKKLAAGADHILLDVKVGNGAFMKNLEDARQLAKTMVSIGCAHGKKTAALLTRMDTPLGQAVGNGLEVLEALQVLKGGGADDLRRECLLLVAHLLKLAGMGTTLEECEEQARQAIESKRALHKFYEMVEAQGGDISVLKDEKKFPRADYEKTVYAPQSGYICSMDTEKIGTSAMLLGAGRQKKEDSIDSTAGLLVLKKTGDMVHKGEEIARLFASNRSLFSDAEELYLQALSFSENTPVRSPLILGCIEENELEHY
ncbi:thymidine phosphorylase [uncultured Ruthenibacterium sp.]|uniref:thymidine phosphorylase n=1 Tax=uncultured Ruthenibacterium sp. TaxID=1905347 RepID=UPI00349EC8B5